MHTFETSGSFIFNGSKSETLIFDGTFERLIVKTDYALSRSGDRLKSTDIQALFNYIHLRFRAYFLSS